MMTFTAEGRQLPGMATTVKLGIVKLGIAVLGVAVLGMACGSPPPPEQVENNSLNVTIFAGGARRPAPASIDPAEPRAAAARAELTALLGHPLAFELDAAAAEGMGDRLHQAYVAALEEAATALDGCRRAKPDVFAFGAPKLERIRIQYDPVRSSERPRLEGGALSVRVHPGERELFDGSGLCRRFEDGLMAERALRFDADQPARVPVAEHAAYFEFLSRGSNAERSALDEELDHLRRAKLLVELRPLLVQPELREKADEWLTRFGAQLSSSMREAPQDAALIAALASSQKAWITWVNERGAQLGRHARERLAELLFLDGSRGAPPALREGFDSAAFAGPIIDELVANIATEDQRKSEDRLWAFVVCRARQERAGRPSLSLSKFCNGVFYGDLAGTPGGRQRLAALLIKKQSDVLTQTAVLHALRTRGPEDASALVELLEPDRHVQHVALRALGDYGGWRAPGTSEHPKPLEPKALVAHIPRWWKQMPEQRSALLYLLVHTSGSGAAKLPWHRLAEFLGARIDAKALAAYLAEDFHTLHSVSDLMGALSPGWPRAPVIVPGFERWLDADAEGRVPDGHAYYVAERVTAALCVSGDPADIAALQRSLRQRADRFPEQTRRLQSFITPAPESLCPARPRPSPGVERITFGD